MWSGVLLDIDVEEKEQSQGQGISSRSFDEESYTFVLLFLESNNHLHYKSEQAVVFAACVLFLIISFFEWNLSGCV